MSKSNKILLGLIGLLLIANGALMVTKKRASTLAYDETMFAIADTAAIQSIQIGEVSLIKKGKWFVGEYPADPSFTDHLLNLLMRVRVKKPIGEAIDGVEVSVDDEDFVFGWNATKTKTYFSKDGKAYEVEIPGFSDYLGGIFELNADQWRDRLVYDGSWRTIQELTLDYADSDEADFRIEFDNDFFLIDGISVIDTLAMMNYLNQFQYFQANELISPGRFPGLDSLVETAPLATLTLDDINRAKKVSFQIYPKRAEDQFYLFQGTDGTTFAVDVPRASQILRVREDFVRK